MGEINSAIEQGFHTVSDFNDFKFEKDFEEFKQHIRYNHSDDWENIKEEDVQRLFIYKMFSKGYMPNELTVSDYLDDDGVAPKVNYFSNSELALIKAVEDLDEKDFNFQRNLGVETMMKMLKELTR